MLKVESISEVVVEEKKAKERKKTHITRIAKNENEKGIKAK